MKNYIILKILLVSLIASNKLISLNDSLNVLFIGNSITYFNNMPYMFKDIANNMGEKVAVSVYAPGGTGFINHVNDANVYALFRNTKWDKVVLQPGSNESPGLSYPVNTTINNGRKLIDSIYKYSPCAKVFIYQIPYGVQSATSYGIYNTVQTMIKDSVQKMADVLKLQIIPAGQCVKTYYSTNQNLELHNAYNDIHPNVNGSFMIASAVYNTLFQSKISNCTYYSSLTQSKAQAYFRITDSIVLNYKNTWRINTYNLNSDFNFNINGSSVSFTCQSANYNSVYWNFDNNITSTIISPTINYTTNNLYNVKLISTSAAGCKDSITKQVNLLNTLVMNKTNTTYFKIYPNPFVNNIQISSSLLDKYELKILNNNAEEVFKTNVENENTTINVSHLTTGIYHIMLYNNNKLIETTRIIKNQ